MTLLPQPCKGRPKRANLANRGPGSTPSRPQRRQNRGGNSFRPHASGGGGPRCAAARWRGRGPRRSSFGENETVSQKPPPPPFARLRSLQVVPPRTACGGGRHRSPFSRCVFCSHPSYAARHSQKHCPKTLPKNTVQKHCPKTTPHLDLRQSLSAWIVRMASRSNAAQATKSFQTRFRQSKEAERRQTRVSLLHLAAKRAPWPGRARLSAFHCGSCQGDSWSPRLSVRPRFPGSVRRVRSLTAAPTGGRRPRASPRVLPAPEKHCPSPVSTSHTGHGAGRVMPDAARVQRGRTLCPRAPDPLPPTVRRSAGVLVRGAGRIGFYSLSLIMSRICRHGRDYALIL